MAKMFTQGRCAYFRSAAYRDFDNTVRLGVIPDEPDDLADRDAAILCMQRIVSSQARRYASPEFPWADMFQEGMLAVTAAYNSYEPAAGTPWIYWAAKKSKHAMQDIVYGKAHIVPNKRLQKGRGPTKDGHGDGQCRTELFWPIELEIANEDSGGTFRPEIMRFFTSELDPEAPRCSPFMQRAIAGALKSLNSREEQAARLVFIDGVPATRAAERMRINYKAIEHVLKRARQKLHSVHALAQLQELR